MTSKVLHHKIGLLAGGLLAGCLVSAGEALGAEGVQGRIELMRPSEAQLPERRTRSHGEPRLIAGAEVVWSDEVDPERFCLVVMSVWVDAPWGPEAHQIAEGRRPPQAAEEGDAAEDEEQRKLHWEPGDLCELEEQALQRLLGDYPEVGALERVYGRPHGIAHFPRQTALLLNTSMVTYQRPGRHRNYVWFWGKLPAAEQEQDNGDARWVLLDKRTHEVTMVPWE